MLDNYLTSRSEPNPDVSVGWVQLWVAVGFVYPFGMWALGTVFRAPWPYTPGPHANLVLQLLDVFAVMQIVHWLVGVSVLRGYRVAAFLSPIVFGPVSLFFWIDGGGSIQGIPDGEMMP